MLYNLVADIFNSARQHRASERHGYAVDIWSVEGDGAFVEGESSIVQILLRSPPFEDAELRRPNGTYLRVVPSSTVRSNEPLEYAALVVSPVLKELVYDCAMRSVSNDRTVETSR